MAVLASVGVAVASPGMSTTSLLRDADIAMYEAKRAGKGQIRIFDPAMRLVATKHLEYRSDLGEALERGQMRLVYMPFVDLRSGQVVGAEALVRWHHPQHGDIPASEFVPIAERSGLIVPMGYWLIEQGLAEVASWRPELFCSFNVSAVQIRQPDFVERLVALVDEYHVDPQTIMLELTETVLVDEGDRATETVTRLREEGFRFAIDDFGAGYCSLSYLQRHPVDLLKIDIQGGELSALTGGRRVLSDAVAVQTEVGFHRLYEDQPTFADVDLELRRQGFVPHSFVATRTWPLSPVPWADRLERAARHLVEADLLYVRDLARLDLLSDGQLVRLAVISDLVYGSAGVALRCIGELVGRGALDPAAETGYRALATARLKP